MREWEWAILQGMQTFLRTPLGDVLMVWVTHLGDGGILWILMGVLLLAKRGHRRTGALVLAALAIEFLVCNVCLKNMVAAPRPCDLDPSVPLLIARPTDYSFPSGHTGASFAAVAALCLGKEKRWYLALVPALLIAFSRLYLYVHFPVDILGGMVVGIASGFLAWCLGKMWVQKISQERGGKRKGVRL